MLVLTRRVGESVVISEDIYCTIVGIKTMRSALLLMRPSPSQSIVMKFNAAFTAIRLKITSL